jgi:hopene-associated glycosyltransferase HpnB
MIALALLTLAIWLYLLFGRGFFWLAREASPLRYEVGERASWPSVVAVIPARNEAAVVGRAIASLLAQDYAGGFHIVLVDDHSTDGTAEAARQAAGAQLDRVAIVAARPLPSGWTGKLWALSEGVRQVDEPPALYLFTDADIAHHPSNLSELVAQLEGERRDLVSLMVKLRCESLAERFLIPPFVFFFAMLYPLAWSNDRRRATAAAAGGCILMRRSAYERIGGWESLKGELIDDCALARRVKRGGSIWLGLTQRTISLRAYPRVTDIWNMVARTAYTQLGYSPLLLGGTALGMAIPYFLPPL